MISVALCTYNGGTYLTEQLRSLAAQQRLPDELVVCDDGSTDASVDVVREFASRAPFPVRLEIQPRRLGARANFARAIELCRGTWIALCDQDDVWRPDKLYRQGEILASDPAVGLVFSDAELVDADGRSLGARLWQAVRFTRDEQSQFYGGRESAVLLRHNVISGATAVFRSDLRELVLPIAEGWVHDGWIALLAAAVARCVPIAEPLIAYRQHPRQQIGERKRSLYQQYLRGKTKTASDFQLVADNYAAAGRRLATVSGGLRDPHLLAALDAKVAHYRAKAVMRGPRRWRMPLVLRELLRGHYRHYSSGWRSLAQDLFL